MTQDVLELHHDLFELKVVLHLLQPFPQDRDVLVPLRSRLATSFFREVESLALPHLFQLLSPAAVLQFIGPVLDQVLLVKQLREILVAVRAEVVVVFCVVVVTMVVLVLMRFLRSTAVVGGRVIPRVTFLFLFHISLGRRIGDALQEVVHSHAITTSLRSTSERRDPRSPSKSRCSSCPRCREPPHQSG